MSTSTIPLPQAFFFAVLQVLSKKPDGLRRRDLYELVADDMALTPAQRVERLPSLTHLRYRHRIGWCLNLLKNASLIESPSSGVWRLSSAGQRTLTAHPAGLDDDTTKMISRQARAAGLRAELEADC